MISKLEYNSSKDQANIFLAELYAIKNNLKQQTNERQRILNNYMNDQQLSELRKIEVDESEQSLSQTKIDIENKIAATTQTLKKIEKEISMQYIVATDSGTVNYLFNAVQSSNIISKGELLISLSPKYNSYYAKAYIPQKSIQYIATPMVAHIKLDAYYHLEHGIMKGKVTYVSERKENDKFYVLIELNTNQKFNLKSGYTIKGEILNERTTLIRYITKKLFKKFEKTST
jgi:HlyD family secretion protein